MSSIEDGRQFAFPEGAIRKDMSSKRYIILVLELRLVLRHLQPKILIAVFVVETPPISELIDSCRS